MENDELYDTLTGEVNALESIDGDISADGELDGDVEIPRTIFEKDYEKLENLPSINNTILKGNYNEIDPTVPTWAKEENKPSYSATEIGAVSREDTIKYAEIDRMFAAVFGV